MHIEKRELKKLSISVSVVSRVRKLMTIIVHTWQIHPGQEYVGARKVMRMVYPGIHIIR